MIAHETEIRGIESIYIKVYVYMYVCVCVCVYVRHNYLSGNGIVSFPSFTRLYKKEYKQGEMWHSAQRAEILEEKWIYIYIYVCSSLAVARQRVHDS
jgi:hypothetical protein